MTRDSFPEYSLSCHVTAEMLETGQAHACHRFVVEDDEEEKPRLLVSSPCASLLQLFSYADPCVLVALVLQSRYSDLFLNLFASRQYASIVPSQLFRLPYSGAEIGSSRFECSRSRQSIDERCQSLLRRRFW